MNEFSKKKKIKKRLAGIHYHPFIRHYQASLWVSGMTRALYVSDTSPLSQNIISVLITVYHIMPGSVGEEASQNFDSDHPFLTRMI